MFLPGFLQNKRHVREFWTKLFNKCAPRQMQFTFGNDLLNAIDRLFGRMAGFFKPTRQVKSKNDWSFGSWQPLNCIK